MTAHQPELPTRTDLGSFARDSACLVRTLRIRLSQTLSDLSLAEAAFIDWCDANKES